MNYALLLLSSLLFAAPSFAQDSPPVHPVTKKSIELFALQDVRLQPSPFKSIMDLDHDYLLSLDPDRLVSWFRRESGLTPKAPPYPWWESEDVGGIGPLSGHIMGFYLSSMSMMYASTGDDKILEKLKYTLDELTACQNAFGNGYLLPTINGKQLFQQVATGNFTTANPVINNIWEPTYVLNKLMLGLYGVYTNCHLPEAKSLLTRTANWFGDSILNKLSHEQVQRLLVCEHGSLNESFVQVYLITGDNKYLQWAGRLNDEQMLTPLSKHEDILDGWHANTQIPKFTGFENLYNYTGAANYTDAARFFWNAVVKQRSWITGGNSMYEHFFPASQFDEKVILPNGPESCNSVNMMRLTEILYQDYAEPEKIDYYERVLYNHILANYNPENGMCAYYTSMRPGHYKVYGTPYNTFWCCTGTGMEAPAKFTRMIYAHDSSDLYVNMFIPSILQWRDKDLTLTQTTSFPDEEKTTLQLHLKQSAHFSLLIRHPDWLASAHLSIRVNGRVITATSKSGGYARITRLWKDGDQVEIQLPGKIEIAPLTKDEKFLTIQYGPIVMAAKVDNHGLKKEDFTCEHEAMASRIIPMLDAPSLSGEISSIRRTIKHLDRPGLTLSVAGSDGNPIELIPFDRIAFSRYAVYFQHFATSADYLVEKNKMLTDSLNDNALQKQTVDAVVIGDSLSEKSHHLEAVHSNSGGPIGNKWRDANKGGYFMYNLKLIPGKPAQLYLEFSGYDEGPRIFEVRADGQLLATLDHSHKIAAAGGGLYPLSIDLPQELTAGKDNITIKLQATQGNIAGGIFDLRILSR